MNSRLKTIVKCLAILDVSAGLIAGADTAVKIPAPSPIA